MHPYLDIFAVFRIRIRIGSRFNQVSGSVSGFEIRIQEGKNYPKNIKKLNRYRSETLNFFNLASIFSTDQGPELITFGSATTISHLVTGMNFGSFFLEINLIFKF